MFRGENPLMAVFRRRSSNRDLTNTTVATEEDEDHDSENETQPLTHEGRTIEEEKEEVESDLSVTTHLVIQQTQSFYEDSNSEDEQDDENDLKRPAICLRANPVKDSVDGSSCGSSQRFLDAESSSVNDSTDTNAKNPELEAIKPKRAKPPKVWINDAAKLGWTPGQVKMTSKNHYALEPVVALTDTLDEISLDDSIIRAMAGKRGSFSSEISAVTEESDGSESKRVRLWASVFRTRDGSRT